MLQMPIEVHVSSHSIPSLKLECFCLQAHNTLIKYNPVKVMNTTQVQCFTSQTADHFAFTIKLCCLHIILYVLKSENQIIGLQATTPYYTLLKVRKPPLRTRIVLYCFKYLLNYFSSELSTSLACFTAGMNTKSKGLWLNYSVTIHGII